MNTSNTTAIPEHLIKQWEQAYTELRGKGYPGPKEAFIAGCECQYHADRPPIGEDKMEVLVKLFAQYLSTYEGIHGAKKSIRSYLAEPSIAGLLSQLFPPIGEAGITQTLKVTFIESKGVNGEPTHGAQIELNGEWFKEFSGASSKEALMLAVATNDDLLTEIKL